jgi:hypothetical protein
MPTSRNRDDDAGRSPPSSPYMGRRKRLFRGGRFSSRFGAQHSLTHNDVDAEDLAFRHVPIPARYMRIRLEVESLGMTIVRQLLDQKGYEHWSIGPDKSVHDAIKMMAEGHRGTNGHRG